MKKLKHLYCLFLLLCQFICFAQIGDDNCNLGAYLVSDGETLSFDYSANTLGYWTYVVNGVGQTDITVTTSDGSITVDQVQIYADIDGNFDPCDDTPELGDDGLFGLCQGSVIIIEVESLSGINGDFDISINETQIDIGEVCDATPYQLNIEVGTENCTGTINMTSCHFAGPTGTCAGNDLSDPTVYVEFTTGNDVSGVSISLTSGTGEFVIFTDCPITTFIDNCGDDSNPLIEYGLDENTTYWVGISTNDSAVELCIDANCLGNTCVTPVEELGQVQLDQTICTDHCISFGNSLNTEGGCADPNLQTVWITFEEGDIGGEYEVSSSTPGVELALYPSACFATSFFCGNPIIENLQPIAPNGTATSVWHIAVSAELMEGDSNIDFELCVSNTDIANNCLNGGITINEQISSNVNTPPGGPFTPGEQITICFDIPSYQPINCDILGAIILDYGDCWVDVSSGGPVILDPIEITGDIPGSWVWFEDIETNDAFGNALIGDGWVFTGDLGQATGNIEDYYGDGFANSCNDQTGPYNFCIQMQVQPQLGCGNVSDDCSVALQLYSNSTTGFWEGHGCNSTSSEVFGLSSNGFTCCPIVNNSIDGSLQLCTGDNVVLDESALVIDQPELAEGDGTVSWWLDDGTFSTPFSGTFTHSGADNCISESLTIYATIECVDNGSVISAGEYTLEVFPAFQPIMEVTDEPNCTNAVTLSCSYSIVNVLNATGGADVINWNSSTNTYTTPNGGASGTIDLEISTGLSPNACGETQTVTIITPACIVTCPNISPVIGTDEICSGNLATEISLWEFTVGFDADVSSLLADSNTGSAILYSTEEDNPNGLRATGVHSGADNCTEEDQITYAYVLCFGDDAIESTGDDYYILVGTHTLTVYPVVQAPNVSIDSDNCMTTVTVMCADMFTGIGNTTGGANSVNWNASNGEYIASPGEAAGTIEIEITSGISGNLCASEMFEINTSGCGTDCPMIVQAIDGNLDLCDGNVASPLDESMLSIDDASLAVNNGEVTWFTDVDLTSEYNGANLNHSSADICSPENIILYAAIECIADPGMYISAGQIIISIYAPIDPTIVIMNDGSCGPSIDASICATYVVTNDYDSNGGSPDFNGDFTSGNISFNISQMDAPDGCNEVILNGTYDCEVCIINHMVSNILCSDGGTPSDPSDDEYTFEVEVNGSNTGSGWTSDDPNNTTGLYSSAEVFGPYLISDGDLSFTITDGDDGGCTTTVMVNAPSTCSNTCEIDHIVSNILCSDGGTPSDPSDDEYTFEVEVTGSNTGSGWTSDDPNNTTGLYSSAEVFGPYLISDGDLSFTITDGDDGGCTTEVMVVAPNSCSGTCSIGNTVTNILCSDGGTPSDSSDDEYTFEVEVSGSNTGSGWTSDDPNNTTGLYSSAEVFGPYLISDGDLSFTITDGDDGGCTTTVMVTAPSTCSNACEIDHIVSNILCSDGGTPSDPSDDEYTFEVEVTGSNTGSGWTSDDPNSTTGLYSSAEVFGPYLISDGDLSFTITDGDDGGCTTEVMVVAPNSCSGTCSIGNTVTNILCSDGGTPSDPSDDEYTFEVEVSGSNTGSGWTSDDPNNTTGLYSSAEVFGPYLISDGDLSFTITDGDDGGCTTEVMVVAPNSCSGTCSIGNTVTNILCSDGGTPSDPSDDEYTFEVEVIGSNTGSGWTSDDPNNTTGLYSSAEVFGPYLISDGDLSFTITDGDDGGCTTEVMVVAPNSCSGTCSIGNTVTNILCSDGGTPSDPSDDEYTFEVEVTGSNTGSGWTSDDPNNTTGLYSSAEVFGPYLISDGDLSFTVTDGDDGGCTTEVVVTAPSTCSNSCLIENTVTNILCSDGGTPSDPSDDEYTFEVEVIGSNTGSGWTSDDPNNTTGLYSSAEVFGPYLISDGDLNFTISDAADVACTTPVMVTAPATCSDVCSISNVVTNIVCNDGGTASDPSDDTYSFDVEVSGSNTGVTWSSSDPNGMSGAYGGVVSFGPYLISGGDLSFTISDVVDVGCTTPVNVSAPNTCSDACLISHTVSNILCNDGGTASDPSDDTYTFDIEVSGSNTGTMWNSDDPNGVSGAYNTVISFGPYAISGGDLSFTISDGDDVGCTTSVMVTAPNSCSGTCSIGNVVSNIQCSNGGTPSDPSDDVYSFDVEVNGSNTGASWIADDPNATTGAYSTVISFGPYLISSGDLSFTISDDGDNGCTTAVSVTAPSSCSDVCDIDHVVSNIMCNDGGTPSDPSDDVYSFDVEVTGLNTGSTWSSSDPNGTTGSYGSVVSFGSYLISGGDLSFTITDGVDGGCVSNVMVSAPSTCSDACSISNVVTNIQCSDNGTPSDPSDDVYSFDVEVIGSNTGVMWSADDPNTMSGAYSTVISFGPYAISGGDLSFTITDGVDGSCTTPVMVVAPSTCSDVCVISHVVSNVACNDGGTPSDPSDDVYSFDVEVSGSNTGASWSSNDPNGTSGGYDAVISFGPYAISGGDLSFTITDDVSGGCTTSVMVTAPSTCSDVCDIDHVVSNVLCNDNGTASDPSDDTYTFEVEVSGSNTGASWSADDPNGTTGAYSTVISFGPYDISGGDLSFTITDDVDGACTTVVSVTAPSSCSGTCSIGNEVSNIECNDNGTPSDDSDDTYTFEVEVNGSNTDVSWSADDPNGTNGAYGTVINFGPYDISAGDLSFTITDGVDGGCTTSVDVTAPSTCSDACAIDHEVSNIACNDGGTPSDPSDDTYSFEIEVTGLNTGSTWSSDDPNGTSGSYGSVVVFGPYDISGGDLGFVITDGVDGLCETIVEVEAPSTCSDACLLESINLTNVVCNDGGTPTDPSDDYIEFDIDPTGLNLGFDYDLSVDVGSVSPTLGSYGGVQTYALQDGSAGSGNVTLTIVDGDDGSCFLEIEIEDPGSCSDMCLIESVGLSNLTCNDNGTGLDNGDDYIVFEIDPMGFNLGSNYSLSVDIGTIFPSGGAYGGSDMFELDAGSAGSGNVYTITLTDNGDSSCTFDFEIMDPGACSDVCNITNANLIDIECNDNGTPSDPSDDYVSFSLDPEGNSNIGTSYDVEVDFGSVFPDEGDYGSETVFELNDGSAGSGDVIVTITDQDDPDCSIQVTISDPGSCSDECVLEQGILENIVCDDNRTEQDGGDDYIIFDLTVTGLNTSGGYTILSSSGGISPLSGNVDVQTTFELSLGSAGSGDVVLTIIDNGDNSCQLEIDLEDPGSCSTSCEIELLTEELGDCNDNGTSSDGGDDFYELTLELDGVNVDTEYELILDGVDIGDYMYGTEIVIQIPADGMSHDVEVIDGEEISCTLFIGDYGPLSGCSDACPDIEEPVAVQSEYRYCTGEAIPSIEVTISAGLTITWYDMPTGGTNLGTGTSYTPSTAGTYYAEATDNSGCMSERIAITVIEDALPSYTVDARDCSMDLSMYTATISTMGVISMLSEGTATDNGDGTWTISDVTSGTDVTGVITSAEGCEVALMITAPDCNCPDVDEAVAVQSEYRYCAGEAIPSIEVTISAGLTITWYDMPTGGTDLGIGTSYTPSTAGTYYAEATDNSGCMSERIAITLIEDALPSYTVDARDCSMDLSMYTATISTTATISMLSGGTATDNGDGTWTISDITSGTDVTGVITSAEGCEVALMITAPDCNCPDVDEPVAVQSEYRYCAGEAIPSIEVTISAGLTITWYDMPTGGTNLGTGTNYTPSTPATYYAEATDNSGCMSERIAITVIEDALPSYTVDARDCSMDLSMYTATISTTATISMLSEGTATDNGDGTWTISDITSGTDVTGVITSAEGCEVALMITAPDCNCPDVDEPVAVQSEYRYCAGEAIPSIEVTINSGLTITWYDMPTGGTDLGTGTTFTPSTAGTYYAEATDNSGCMSERIAITVIEDALPTYTVDARDCSMDLSMYTATISTTGAISMLSEGTATDNGDGTWTISDITSGTDVTGVITSAEGCEVALMITAPDCNCPDVDEPVAVQSEYRYCAGEAIPSIEVTISAGLTITWYDMPTGGTDIGTGTSYTPSTAGTYYAEATDMSGCISERISITVVEDAIPTYSLGSIDCSMDLMSYTVDLTTDGMVSSVDAGMIVDNGDGTWSITDIPTGMDVMIQISNAAGCMVTPIFGSPDCNCPDVDEPVAVQSEYRYCAGEAIPSLEVTTNTDLTITWYDMAIGGTELGTGTTFTPSGVGTYYAEATDGSGCMSDRIELSVIEDALPTYTVDARDCTMDLSMYTATISTMGTISMLSEGTLTDNGDGTWTISDITADTDVTGLITSAEGCETALAITAPDCNCPDVDEPVAVQTMYDYCTGEPIPSIAVSGAMGMTINWYSTPSGGDLLTTGSSYTPMSPGTYYAEAVDGAGCESERIAIIVEENMPPTAIILLDPESGIINCLVDTVRLYVAPQENVQYSWIVNNELPVIFTEYLIIDEAEVTLMALDTMTGCMSEDFIMIEDFTAFPILNIEDANAITCIEETITIDASNTMNVGVVDYQWLQGDGTSIPGATSLSLDVSEPGSYILVGMDETSGCENRDTIEVLDNRVFPTAIASDDVILPCEPDSVMLMGSGTGIGTNISLSWSTNNGNIRTDMNTGEIIVDQVGMYSLVVTDNDNGCTIEEVVEVLDNGGVDITASPTTSEIVLGSSTEVDLDITTMAYDSLWILPSTGLSCDDCEDIVGMPSITTDYTAYVIDENGCIDSTMFRIDVIEISQPIFIPNTIDPLDPTNSTMTINSEIDLEVITFTIYDRWGNLVFKRDNFMTNDPANGWYAEFNNEPVEQGVYVYYIEYTDATGRNQTLIGDITVIR